MARKYKTNVVLLAKLAPDARKVILFDGPLTAEQVAQKIHLTCEARSNPREARRRVIRDVVAWLRERGEMICANLTEGYWLARGWKEWRAYTESEKAGAVFKFVRLRREQDAVREKSSGQGTLFGNGDTPKRENAESEWATA